MKEIICIVCPNGCRLQVDEAADYAVSGHKCPRGKTYGREELTNPVRTLTSTVRIEGAAYPRLPVKTDHPIPKAKIPAVMAQLDAILAHSPVKRGDIIAENIADSGANLVACRDL